MVKYNTEEIFFQFTWDRVVTAFWKRYPNPFSTHVLTEDVVERYRKGNQLISKRLICKTSKFPKWAEKFVGKFHDVYLVEESVVDLESKRFTTYTRNISLQNVMATEEKCVYSQNEGNQEVTVCHREAWFDSQICGFGGMIASYGLKSYKKNIVKTSNGYNFVLEALFGKTNLTANARLPETRKLTDNQAGVKKTKRKDSLKWKSVIKFQT